MATQRPNIRFYTSEEVNTLGILDPQSHSTVDKAIDAVKDGVASDRQRALAVEASKQAGPRGRAALAALQDRR